MLVICGDFNLPCMNWSGSFDPQSLSTQEEMFASFVVDNDLLQLVNETKRGSYVLDQLFVTNALAVYNVSHVLPFCTSDHDTVMWHSWFPSREQAYNNNLLLYDYRRAEYNALSHHLM